MIVKDTTVVVRWVLKKTPNPGTYTNASYFDLQITAPNGAVTYHEGGSSASSNWADSYKAPTATEDGYITYNWHPDQEGVYTMILGEGISSSFTIIKTRLLMAIEQDTEVSDKVNLP